MKKRTPKNNFMPEITKKSSSIKQKNTRGKTNEKKIRLNKFISNSGICSRREADKFIQAGIVTVNNVSITKMGFRISNTDVVKFNGQKIKSEKLTYVLLNKPKNYSTRINSPKKLSVMNLISTASKEKIYPVDKLQKSETGLLLFTNDDNLAKKFQSKTKKIKSIYQIKLDKNLRQTDVVKIKNGIFINGEKNTFDSISYIQNKQKNEVGIENNKGGPKHLKEIFEKLNYKIVKLDRVFFGGLTKKNLPRKHYRHLTEDEINILKRL